MMWLHAKCRVPVLCSEPRLRQSYAMQHGQALPGNVWITDLILILDYILAILSFKPLYCYQKFHSPTFHYVIPHGVMTHSLSSWDLGVTLVGKFVSHSWRWRSTLHTGGAMPYTGHPDRIREEKEQNQLSPIQHSLSTSCSAKVCPRKESQQQATTVLLPCPNDGSPSNHEPKGTLPTLYLFGQVFCHSQKIK